MIDRNLIGGPFSYMLLVLIRILPTEELEEIRVADFTA